MTGSQIKSAVATVVTIISAVGNQLLTLAGILPPAWVHWLLIVVAIAGAITVALNQSLSTAHTSVPVAQAEAINLEGQLRELKAGVR